MYSNSFIKTATLGLMRFLYRFATEGPFKEAWELMKDNPDSFWSSRPDVAERIATDPSVAVFDFKRILSGSEQFKRCRIETVPKR